MPTKRKARWTAVLTAGALLCAVSYAQPARAADDGAYAKALIGMGVAVLVSVGLGIGLAVGSKLAADKADDRGDELYAKGYAAPCRVEPDSCQQIADGLQTRDDLALGATISFIVSGSLLAAGTSYAIKEYPRGGRGQGRSGSPYEHALTVPAARGAQLGIVVQW